MRLRGNMIPCTFHLSALLLSSYQIILQKHVKFSRHTRSYLFKNNPKVVEILNLIRYCLTELDGKANYFTYNESDPLMCMNVLKFYQIHYFLSICDENLWLAQSPAPFGTH